MGKSEGKEPESQAKLEPKQDEAKEKIGELRVYVAGLPWKATQDDVMKEFSKCGDILRMKLLLDEKERSKGIAFITFKKPEGMKAALQRDGDVDTYPGRTLKVSRVNATKNSWERKKLEDAKKKDKKSNEDENAKKKDMKSNEGESVTLPDSSMTSP